MVTGLSVVSLLCMSNLSVPVAYVWMSESVPLPDKGFTLYLLNITENMAWERNKECFIENFNRDLQGKKLLY